MRYSQAIERHNRKILLAKIPGTNEWEVQEEFIWYIDWDEKSSYSIICEWFVTNFGSIPRLLWWFLNPTQYISYVLHDNLYARKCIHRYGEIEEISRKEADVELYKALRVEGMWLVKALMVYVALRAFGWYAWIKS